jgi:Resolvase, N terminal domain
MQYTHSVDSVKTAFAYLRVSGKGQLEGDGFTRQREAIELYAKANDIEIIKTFEEEGVSGKTDLENRPALTDLIGSLDVAGTRLVLVERLDRLARFLTVQESILQDLKRKQFDLVSVTEPDLCSDDPTRTLMRQVLGAFSEFERSMIVLKLRCSTTDEEKVGPLRGPEAIARLLVRVSSQTILIVAYCPRSPALVRYSATEFAAVPTSAPGFLIRYSCRSRISGSGILRSRSRTSAFIRWAKAKSKLL